jgi:hypothetical protein
MNMNEKKSGSLVKGEGVKNEHLSFNAQGVVPALKQNHRPEVDLRFMRPELFQQRNKSQLLESLGYDAEAKHDFSEQKNQSTHTLQTSQTIDASQTHDVSLEVDELLSESNQHDEQLVGGASKISPVTVEPFIKLHKQRKAESKIKFKRAVKSGLSSTRENAPKLAKSGIIKAKTKSPKLIKKVSRPVLTFTGRSYKKLAPVVGRVNSKLKISQHKKAWGAGGVLVVMVSSYAALPLVSKTSKDTNKSGSNSPVLGASTTSQDPAPKPDYEVIKPKESEPTEAQIKFDPSKKLSTYTGDFKNMKLVISLQKLNENDAADPSLILKAKDSFQANITFESNKGTVYVYNKQEKNQHAAILKYKDFLIFIQAPRILDDKEWIEFIDSLN